jgi:hypothetical protein
MRKIVVLTLLTVATFLTSFSANAGQDCQAVRWPFRKEPKNFEPAALEKIERLHLFAYLYFELATAPEQRIPGLAKKLFFYLVSTELNEGRGHLLEVLQSTAELDSNHPAVIQTAEICGIEARLPSSTKVKTKIKPRAKPGVKKK